MITETVFCITFPTKEMIEFIIRIEPGCEFVPAHCDQVPVSTGGGNVHILRGKQYPARVTFFNEQAALLFELKYSSDHGIFVSSRSSYSEPLT